MFRFSERILAYAHLFLVFKEEETKHIYYHRIYGIKIDKNTSVRECPRVPVTSSKCQRWLSEAPAVLDTHLLSCLWGVKTALPKADEPPGL